YLILQEIFEKDLKYDEHICLTAIYAFFPGILCHVFHLNPDFGVLNFFVLLLLFLLRNQVGLAAFFGTLMTFTKETGAALYVVSIVAYLLIQESLTFSFWKKIRSNWLKYLVLSIPLCLLLIRLVSYKLFFPERQFWYSDSALARMDDLKLLFG